MEQHELVKARLVLGEVAASMLVQALAQKCVSPTLGSGWMFVVATDLFGASWLQLWYRAQSGTWECITRRLSLEVSEGLAVSGIYVHFEKEGGVLNAALEAASKQGG